MGPKTDSPVGSDHRSGCNGSEKVLVGRAPRVFGSPHNDRIGGCVTKREKCTKKDSKHHYNTAGAIYHRINKLIRPPKYITGGKPGFWSEIRDCDGHM
jgi:hypothetical protein